MHEPDDQSLLRNFVEQGSEEAFSALVARHVDKVYSIALRLARNPHHAEEITQAVFVILARKSRQLGKGVILSGWLCRTARFAAITHMRSEFRRARREQEACNMQTSPENNDSNTPLQIAPFLDDAMAELSQKDHLAVVLRFFDGKSMKEVGALLGASEDAAKQRVGRAVEKLRQLLSRRGVAISSVLLTSALSTASTQAAPAIMADTAAGIALTKGVTSGGSILAVVEGVLKTMAWMKLKTPVVAGAATAYAVGLSMRELSLIETGCLCMCLVLCLVLPLMMSARPAMDPVVRMTCLKTVWLGQAALALAGLAVIFFEGASIYATIFGALFWFVCVVNLGRHLCVTPRPSNIRS